MNSTDLEALAATLSGISETDVSLAGGASEIVVGGRISIAVPSTASGRGVTWLQHDAPAIYPNVPHGQPRDTLLFGILQDSAEAKSGRPLDVELSQALDERMPGDTADKRAAVSLAMADKFWYRKAGGKGKQAYLLPLHASLPLGFDQAGGVKRDQQMRYKMFRGSILPFLCSSQGGRAVDESLMDGLLDVFRNDDDFTILDREVLRIAADISPMASQPSVQALLNSSRKVLTNLEKAGGAFCQPSLDQFQEDLRYVLGMPLPRRDLIEQVTMLLALHFSIRLLRASVVLSNQLDQVIALFMPGTHARQDPCSAGCVGELERCDLAGMLRFRAGSGGFRSVSLSEPCVTSFRQVTSGYLLPLPVSIATANLTIHVLKELGGPELPSLDIPGLGDALRAADGSFRQTFDAVTRLLALSCGAQQKPAASPDEIRRFAREGGPGLFALREAILEWRRPSMRHEGRDVVFQLVKEVRSGRLIQSNGTRVTFFELDEALIFLLVSIICKNELIPFAEFISRLQRYGLSPQSQAEEALLQRSLERLGMFARYSDAAESAYVHGISYINGNKGGRW
jgi:hypothetical protein